MEGARCNDCYERCGNTGAESDVYECLFDCVDNPITSFQCSYLNKSLTIVVTSNKKKN